MFIQNFLEDVGLIKSPTSHRKRIKKFFDRYPKYKGKPMQLKEMHIVVSKKYPIDNLTFNALINSMAQKRDTCFIRRIGRGIYKVIA